MGWKVCRLKDFGKIPSKGEFIEGGAVVTATLEDVPDEIKDLIACGVFSEEEALAQCTSNGSRERRMVIKQPYIKLTGEDKIPVLQKFENQYTDEELNFDFCDDDDVPFETDDDVELDSSDADSLDWLNQL